MQPTHGGASPARRGVGAIEVVEISHAELTRFVPWHDARALPSFAFRPTGRGVDGITGTNTTRIRRAEPGIYIVDDDGAQVHAGAFDNDASALAWIERRQRRQCRDASDRISAS